MPTRMIVVIRAICYSWYSWLTSPIWTPTLYSSLLWGLKVNIGRKSTCCGVACTSMNLLVLLSGKMVYWVNWKRSGCITTWLYWLFSFC